jgi:hypothetical protein
MRGSIVKSEASAQAAEPRARLSESEIAGSLTQVKRFRPEPPANVVDLGGVGSPDHAKPASVTAAVARKRRRP